MAFTPEGTPLGLLNVQCGARDPEQAGKKHRRHHLPIEEKESLKWLVSYRAVTETQKLCLDTVLISVGDCEADLHELFHAAVQRAAGTSAASVRGTHSQPKGGARGRAGRTVAADEGREGSRDAPGSRPSSRFAPLPYRPARGSYRSGSPHAPVKTGLSPLRVWAVYASEMDHAA
jgi:hypothetical protein